MNKSICLKTDEVRYILDDKKKTIRIPIKRTPSNDEPCGYGFWKAYEERDGRWYIKDYTHSPVWWTLEEYIDKYSKYRVGDVIWVKETWTFCNGLKLCKPSTMSKNAIVNQKNENLVWYKADDNEEIPDNLIVGEKLMSRDKWKSSVHMPKELSRIFLEIVDIKIERLQKMNTEDFLNEGVREYTKEPKEAYIKYWNGSLSKNKKDMYSWEQNPYVWVIEFKRINKL